MTLSHDTVVHRAEDGRMTVRHVRLTGSNEEIGAALGALAADRHGTRPDELLGEPEVTAARHAWASRYWPETAQRARGAARALGLDPDAPGVDALGVTYNLRPPAAAGDHPVIGCSVAATSYRDDTGAPVPYLSRNFDFMLQSLAEVLGGPAFADAEPAMLAEPYLLEVHPSDGGLPCVFLCAFDLLSGVVDGMNAAGLTVAMLQLLDRPDDLSGYSPPQPGLYELEVLRYLLDRCRSVEEALAVFTEHPVYVTWLPCQYVLADAHGAAAVVTPRPGSAPHVVRRQGPDGAALSCTNHALRPDWVPEGPELAEQVADSTARLRQLTRQLAGPARPTRAQVDDALRAVARVYREPGTGRPLAGTVWNSQYHPAERRLDVAFWHSATDPADPSRPAFGTQLTVTLDEPTHSSPRPAGR